VFRSEPVFDIRDCESGFARQVPAGRIEAVSAAHQPTAPMKCDGKPTSVAWAVESHGNRTVRTGRLDLQDLIYIWAARACRSSRRDLSPGLLDG
jgi:hypothetical protein